MQPSSVPLECDLTSWRLPSLKLKRDFLYLKGGRSIRHWFSILMKNKKWSLNFYRGVLFMFSYSSNVYNSIRKISKCFIQSVAPREDGVSVIHHRLCKTIEQYYTGCRATRCSKFNRVLSGWRIFQVERFVWNFSIMTCVSSFRTRNALDSFEII